MPTIEQLREDIASKQTELETCSRELKDLITQRANQQRTVTIKINKIHGLIYRFDLNATEKKNLAKLQSELISDKQELDYRERARASCFNKETGLMFKVGNLKNELSQLESRGAIDYSSLNSCRR
jgi:chromosome segregation ATPase